MTTNNELKPQFVVISVLKRTLTAHIFCSYGVKLVSFKNRLISRSLKLTELMQYATRFPNIVHRIIKVLL